jgi:hypothetical protein
MSKELIEYLKLFHGTYNTVVLLLFFYQGILGLKIRKSENRPARIIKRHRKIGPVAALLGVAGFIAGMTVVFIDAGRIFKYPVHFTTGLLIAALIITTYFISKKIKGPDKYWRDRHYAVGIFILCLYLIQFVLGLGVLL